MEYGDDNDERTKFAFFLIIFSQFDCIQALIFRHSLRRRRRQDTNIFKNRDRSSPRMFPTSEQLGWRLAGGGAGQLWRLLLHQVIGLSAGCLVSAGTGTESAANTLDNCAPVSVAVSVALYACVSLRLLLGRRRRHVLRLSLHFPRT